MSRCSLALLLGLGFLLSRPVLAAEKAAAYPPAMPGREIAETVSTVTGVAISPLLGVSAYGAWHYYKTTPERRAGLPWFAQPWFWAPALALVALCFLKDTLGTAAPTALKKPFDVLETVEHKCSGLIAAGAFVPIAASIFGSSPESGSACGGLGFAAIDLSGLQQMSFLNFLMVPLAWAAFAVVFLASTAINILILLSPFSTVDAALKGFRAAVLASVAASAWINPWLGAVWALVLIIFSAFIAGWSFRLTVLGGEFIWDFLTLRKRRFQPHPERTRLFLARKTAKVPARTYGRIERSTDGKLVFRYRPWLVLPEKRLTLPDGDYAVGSGLIYSTILRVEGQDTRTMLLLPPRYRTHEETLARQCGFSGVRPIGLRAMFRWLKEALGSANPTPAPATA